MLQVEMLSTGDEVLYGQIIDTNAAWLADYLFHQGLPLTGHSTAGDSLDSLVEIIKLRSQYADILIVNGGLGPTSDDLSALAAAKALDEELIEHHQWIVKMERYFARRGRAMADSNRKQAMLPQSAELLDNPVGSACGFTITLNGCQIFFTPGVPSEFKVMVEQQVMPRLQQRFELPQPPLCLRLTSFGRSESGLAQQLDLLKIPEGVVLGYRSSMPIIEIKLTGPQNCHEQMLVVWQQIKDVVAENALYEGTEGLPAILARCLRGKNLTLALSEQATAGLLNWRLQNADVPLLGGELPASTERLSLVQLTERAKSIAERHHASLGLAIGAFTNAHFSLALATPNTVYAQKIHYLVDDNSHQLAQEVIAMFALDLLRRWLNGWPIEGKYEWLESVESLIF